MTAVSDDLQPAPSSESLLCIADFLELAFLLRKIIRHCDNEPLVLQRGIHLLESLVFYADDPSIERQLSGPLVAALRADLNDIYCCWETQLEHSFTTAVESGRFTAIQQYALYERFRRLVDREVSMLDRKPRSNRRILFIGSGPVPISAILLHHMTGLGIDCIDIAQNAIEVSRKLLKMLSLDEAIQVRRESGQTVDPSSYDAVFIALLAKPKRVILKNLASRSGTATRIVCRTSLGLRIMLYEPIDLSVDIPGNLTIAEQRLVRGTADDTISSLLLVKQNDSISKQRTTCSA